MPSHDRKGREHERLAALERQLDPVSKAAIGQLGLAAGWRCWEAGAGRGSMAAWLADHVTRCGSVLATDIGIGSLFGLHQPNITVARHDLEHDDVPASEFDLIHARLVLEHLREPAMSWASSHRRCVLAAGSSWKTLMACVGDALNALSDPTRTIIGAPIVTAWGQLAD